MPTVLKKFTAFQVESAVLVPRNAGPARLARIRRAAHKAHFNYEPRRGYLYVRSRAISSRTNDNYDEFPANEIKQAYRTFVGKPCFINHVNDNHHRARGVIIDAALHEDRLSDGSPDTWAEVLMEIDAIRFPKLAEAILKKRIDRTSMGCDVAYSICSMCGNKATTPAEYCSHIPRLKGKKVLKRNAATGRQEEHLIRETCYGLKFFENSLLVEEPADPTAFFTGVDDSGLKAAASRKVAAADEYECGTDHWPRHTDEHGKTWVGGPDALGDSDCGHPDCPFQECDHEWCKGFPEGWHTRAEHIDPADRDPYSDASHEAEQRMQEAFGSDPQVKDGVDLLDTYHQGPTKQSLLKHFASARVCNCPGSKKIEEHLDVDHSEWAQRMHAAGKTDAWGHPIMQPYDGHGAWACNNYDCPEHPQALYDEHQQGMPGWMQHEHDPDKDIKREVGKTFHEQGLTEDANYLLDQQHTGPTKYSMKRVHHPDLGWVWTTETKDTDPYDYSSCTSYKDNPTFCNWHKTDHLETDGEPRVDVNGHGKPHDYKVDVPECDLCDGYHPTSHHYDAEMNPEYHEDESALDGIPEDDHPPKFSLLQHFAASHPGSPEYRPGDRVWNPIQGHQGQVTQVHPSQTPYTSHEVSVQWDHGPSERTSEQAVEHSPLAPPEQQARAGQSYRDLDLANQALSDVAGDSSWLFDQQPTGPTKKSSLEKTADWYYHRSQVNGEPIVHAAGQPLNDGRPGLDVGDHVLFPSGHSARIHAITPTLLLMEGHGPMHRGPIEGDHSRSIWSSDSIDEAGQDVPEASEDAKALLDSNPTGPTKYSLLKHFASSLCPDCGGEELYAGEHSEHPHLHGTTAVSPDSVHLWQDHHGLTNVPMKWRTPSEHPLWDHFHTEDLAWHPENPSNATEDWRTDPGPGDHLEDTFTPLRQSLNVVQHFASASPDDSPMNHLFKGTPGQEDCHCGWGEDWHPHLTTGPSVKCTTCGHDYKHHALHDPGRYEHLREQEARPPYDPKAVMEQLFGEHGTDYDYGTKELIDGAFRNPQSAEQWLNKGTQGPTKFSLLQHFAGMHGVPLFDVGDKVINFRGDESGTIKYVQDSGHPGKSNKVGVEVDGTENPPEGHPDHVHWQDPGEKYVSHNYEDVWKPHPEAPPEQHAKYHQRKADNKAATDLLSSIEAEHGEDFDWLNDQRLSSRTAGMDDLNYEVAPQPDNWARHHMLHQHLRYHHGYTGTEIEDTLDRLQKEPGADPRKGDNLLNVIKELSHGFERVDLLKRLHRHEHGGDLTQPAGHHREDGSLPLHDHSHPDDPFRVETRDADWYGWKGQTGDPDKNNRPVVHRPAADLYGRSKNDETSFISEWLHPDRTDEHPNRLITKRDSDITDEDYDSPLGSGRLTTRDDLHRHMSDEDMDRLEACPHTYPGTHSARSFPDEGEASKCKTCGNEIAMHATTRPSEIGQPSEHEYQDRGKRFLDRPTKGFTPLMPSMSSKQEFFGDDWDQANTEMRRQDLNKCEDCCPVPGCDVCGRCPEHDDPEMWKQASGFGDGDADDWKTCDQGHRHWGTEGAAGLLIRHRSDDGTMRYLLQHRAPWVDDGDTWGPPAGALHKGETPIQGAHRESVEELGGVPHGLRHIDTHTDDHGGWAFHTLVMESPSMWGSSGGEDAKHEVGEGGTGWYTAEQMKDMKLHPGFKKSWDSTLSKQAARFTLIQGGKPEDECRCDEPDVYDGYAECSVHPQGSKTSAKQVGQRNVWPTRVKIKDRSTGRYTGTHVGGRGLEDRGSWPFRVCEDHLAQLKGDIARHNVEETGHPHTYEVETDTWPMDPTSTKDISACDACTVGSVNQAFAAGHKKRHRTRHHHHRHPQSHPMYKGRWFGGWGHLHGGYPGLGYCCNVPGCLGDDAGTVDSTGATGTDSAGTDGGAGGADGGGSATASRRTATNDFFDPSHTGPKDVAARPHPDQMSDEQLHHHLVADHEYHPLDIAAAPDAWGETPEEFHNPTTPEGKRRAMNDLHNWSHQVSNYALDPHHSGKPMEAGDVPHHHGEGWRPGNSNSFGTDWQTGDLTHMDTGNTGHTIHLDPQSMEFYRQIADHAQTNAEMHQHGQSRVVDLNDPHDLRAHLVEAHDYDPDTDFWRSGHYRNHPALDQHRFDEVDRPLHTHEVRRLHDWEHGHGIKNEDPDYEGGLPGTFLGDSHFHQAHRRGTHASLAMPERASTSLAHPQPGSGYTAKMDPAVPKPDKERFDGVTLSQDDDGYYVRTHRARSDSYETPAKIPDSKIEFIRSTGFRKTADEDQCPRCSEDSNPSLGKDLYRCQSCGFVHDGDGAERSVHQAAAGDTTSGGLTRHDVPAEEVQEGDYLDISGRVRVHKTMQRGDTVTLAWRQRGSKAPGIRQNQVGETVKVWRRGPAKEAAFEANPILDNDWTEYDNGFAHGKAGQSPVSDSNAYLLGHRRGLEEDGRKQASRDEPGGIDEDPGEYPAHYTDGFDRRTYWGPQEVWDRFHELSAQNIRYGPSDGRVTEQHHLQTHLGNPDWVKGHQGQEHQPGPIQQGDVGGGKPWGSDCPFCGADASKVTQAHRGGISPAGVEHYQCSDCQHWLSKRARKTATWIGDHPDEPSLFWRAPKTKKWEVHIHNWTPDRTLREQYGAKPYQYVSLLNTENKAGVHPDNEGKGMQDRGAWEFEKGRFRPNSWNQPASGIPTHVHEQVRRAQAEVNKNAENHADLYGQLAEQKDIADDLRRVPRDMESEQKAHRMFQNMIGVADCPKCEGSGKDWNDHPCDTCGGKGEVNLRRESARMPGGFLTEFSDADDRWSKPEGKAPYDPLKAHHGLEEKQEGHGPWYVTRHPETHKYQVVDAKNRLVSTHSTTGHPSYEIHDPQAERQAYHRATQANQDHGHIPKWQDRDGNEVEDTGLPRWGGNGERIPGTEHARRRGEPVEDGNPIDSQHVQFHYPAPPWEHGTEHPKITEYKQRAADNPAPRVLPPKIVTATSSREHGTTYRRATPEEYDSPGAFHDPSPEDEWHGPYRVIQHAQTGKFHVADNQDRITHYGGRDGMEEQHTAELMRDYADGRQASKEKAKGLAEGLFNSTMEILDPGGTPESRRSEGNMRSMNDLMHRYEGGDQHPLHPGKFGYDEDDEDNGQPYYEVTDPGGSGWKARDYGGSSVRIHHAATGDTEHDIYSFDDRNNSKPEGFGHDELHQTLHKFVHGDPDDSEPYAPAPDFAEATPEIKRWQRRNGYHHG